MSAVDWIFTTIYVLGFLYIALCVVCFLYGVAREIRERLR